MSRCTTGWRIYRVPDAVLQGWMWRAEHGDGLTFTCLSWINAMMYVLVDVKLRCGRGAG